MSWHLQLARIAVVSIAKRDTDHAVFHGAYDWHSAVHSHWSLLRCARWAQRTAQPAADTAEAASLADTAIASLLREDGAALDREVALLKSNVRFEMPYGRAWALRLTVEFEAVRAGDTGLAALGDVCFDSLLAFYKAAPPTPSELEYRNASFALHEMLRYAAHRGAARALELATIGAWVRERFVLGAVPPASLADDLDASAGFFSRAGNWAALLVAAVETGQAPAEEARRLLRPLVACDGAALNPVDVATGAVHHLGMNPSRAWGLACVARALPERRAELRSAVAAHERAARETHARVAGDYYAYDHWVPSFCMRAATEDTETDAACWAA
jgi:hypothetical protein